MKDLAAFEMLEEAACDSSFCSSSSKVRDLIGGNPAHGLPSPIPRAPEGQPKSLTSTPIVNNGGTRMSSQKCPYIVK
jgi:hypothetical protein